MYYWIIRDSFNRVYVGTTSHGSFYKAEPAELTDKINTLNSYIQAMQQALSLLDIEK